MKNKQVQKRGTLPQFENASIKSTTVNMSTTIVEQTDIRDWSTNTLRFLSRCAKKSKTIEVCEVMWNWMVFSNMVEEG